MSKPELKEPKVVLVGCSGVGKTSIISKYINNTFVENYIATNGAIYSSKELKISTKEKIMLQLWDTAGEHKYRVLVKMFMKDTVMAIFVYSPFQRETFDELNNFVKDMKDVCKKKSLFVVAESKNDITDRAPVVSFEEGSAYAESIGAKFHSISSKTGDGIDDMFNEYVYHYKGTNIFSTIVLKRKKKNKLYEKCVG